LCNAIRAAKSSCGLHPEQSNYWQGYKVNREQQNVTFLLLFYDFYPIFADCKNCYIKDMLT